MISLFISAHAYAQGNDSIPHFKKLIWIWLENTTFDEMVDQSYIKELASTYSVAFLTNYQAVSKVTQANAFALITGSDQGLKENNKVNLSVQSLAGLLESKNISWKVYIDSYQGSCYLGNGTGEYRRYRVPFLSIIDIQSNRFLCSKMVGFQMLHDNVEHSTLPQFSLIIPGMTASGASSSEETADSELRNILNPILMNPDGLKETTIIISTMNGNGTDQSPLFTMFLGNGIGDQVKPVPTLYHHYHLLKTIELGLGLGNLNQNDEKAQPIVGIWK